jgi:hypothetical protein
MTPRQASVDFSTPCRLPKSGKAATAARRPFIDKWAKDQAVAQFRMTAMGWTAPPPLPVARQAGAGRRSSLAGRRSSWFGEERRRPYESLLFPQF